MKIAFSGIQSSGALHLGNYLGAIKPWKEIIKNNSAFLMIADLHAITIFQDPSKLRQSIMEVFATYIACGFDPSINKNVKIFLQSNVKEHTELAWIIGCNTPLGWLDRMTQYKDKARENKERECLGLYSYPCLMAADILLYKTNIVPVGEDQKQHLELTRDIALRMNRLYKTAIFTIPEIQISKAKRVMSLKDASKKMSKSDTSPDSRITLTDTSDEIKRKISKSTTGSLESLEVQNLLTIYKEISGKDYLFEGEIKFSAFKKELTDCVIEELTPISTKMALLLKEKEELAKMLKIFSNQVSEIANHSMTQIKNTVF